jgi:hypothetical protein
VAIASTSVPPAVANDEMVAQSATRKGYASHGIGPLRVSDAPTKGSAKRCGALRRLGGGALSALLARRRVLAGDARVPVVE